MNKSFSSFSANQAHIDRFLNPWHIKSCFTKESVKEIPLVVESSISNPSTLFRVLAGVIIVIKRNPASRSWEENRGRYWVRAHNNQAWLRPLSKESGLIHFSSSFNYTRLHETLLLFPTRNLSLEYFLFINKSSFARRYYCDEYKAMQKYGEHKRLIQKPFSSKNSIEVDWTVLPLSSKIRQYYLQYYKNNSRINYLWNWIIRRVLKKT